HDSVTLGGTDATSAVALHNVANGALSASSTDAVNGSQLYATNTNVSNLAGNVTNLAGDVTTLQGDVTTINGQITNMQGQLADAVMYDSSAHDSVTLGGTGATSAVALHNVANGALNASSTDAVNGSQLYATNQSITDLSGQITNINGQLADAVLYDSSAHDSVTLGGTDATSPVALHNVANGALNASSTDAVNGSQLYATNTNVSNLAGDITNINGKLNDAVLYDSSAHDSVTLGGSGATTPVALHNVANGLVNASSFDAVNGSQLYALGSSTADALGGGSTVNSDGSISAPTYVVGGDTYNNVGSAITNLDGRVTQNTTDITNLTNNINNGTIGLVQQDQTTRNITVAKGTDGTIVDFTGTAGTRVLTGVSNGAVNASSVDAVNGSQLYATNQSISNLAGDITNINGQLQDAVMYDSSAHDSVTLGGTGATSAVALHNVANGALNASSTDAVNGSQLYATNQSITDLSGQITNINGQLADAVLYDSSAHDSVTLGGTDATSPVALHNVANGALNASSTDAVNGSQLYATNTNVSNLAGDITNINGKLNDAVLYDSSAHDSVTLGGSGATTPVALHNVANGLVNASSFDAVNGSQLYALGSSTADALGGGSTVNGDGSISAPTYVVGGDTYNNVGSAITNLDGRVTQNTTDITNLTNNINNGTIGLVQQDQTTRNITVAKDTDGTIVDFTGTAGTRVLTGVSNGAVNASSVDAVNGSQLYATNQNISNLAGDITNINGQLQDAVMYDSSAHDSVTLGGSGATTPVALHNVANGLVNASSFDAINGSQLYALGSSTASSLGGGSTVNPDGSISNPTYILSGGTYNNVGSALTNIDGRVSNVINNINNGTIGLVQQDQTTRNITVAKDTDGTVVDFTGTAGTRTLIGVSNGAVNATSTEAVNGSQLYATNQSISNLSGDITNINGKLADAVMYDSSAHDSVTLGGSGATSTVALHNVTAGDISASSNDAVNGSQLYSLIEQVNNISVDGSDPMFTANGDRNTEAASAAGNHATAGGANANASGDWSTASGANSVASATNATAIGAKSTASGTNATAIGAGATATGANSVAIGQGSVATEDNTVSMGSDSVQRRVTNVAAGQNGTDAVNVDQLNNTVNNAVIDMGNQAVQQANNYTNQQISVVRKQMNSLGAAAMAASSLLPNARAEGNFQMAAAAGTYGGESALAIGANWYVSDRLLLNAHVSRSTGSGASTGASVGATFGF
ncbi:YadA-like family protein, partial [Paraburkholderia sp. JHI869]|uniref:YadA-like family protein n=1 Tax=Paraburkholderia sp. JHI869 TaxID=3112959 RepID=UPI00316CDF81